jgi:cell division protein FtsW
MPLDKLKQGSKANRSAPGEQRRRVQSPPVGRSPALESVERKAREQAEQSEPRARKAGGNALRNLGAKRKMSFAAEETLERPLRMRKDLPPMKSKILNAGIVDAPVRARQAQQRTGLTASWRVREEYIAESEVAPVQVISEEEQQKLQALEMQLPRVAGKIDSWLLAVVLGLLCIGLVMVYSASSFLAARDYGDASYFFQKQLLSAFLAIIAMLITMRIDYRQWRRFSLIGLVVTLPLLVIVLIFGANVYGASRWLAIGSYHLFQPSELTKLVLALYIADWLARKGNQVGTFLYGLAPFVILVGTVLGLVLLENDMGTAIIIAALAAAMFFTAGANIVQFLLTMGCGGLIFLTQALKGYRYYRLMGFLDPFKYVTGINLQLYQSLLALGSGGWFGLGLGASRQKTGYLPFPYIDSIFAVIGEELGFIGCAIIVILFLFLAFRGFRLARRTQDVYGALLATGITTWLVLQAVINIGSTTGTLPYTGVPLPFISYGGTSLVISMAAVGVLLNISRYIQEPEKPAFSTRTLTLNMRRKA